MAVGPGKAEPLSVEKKFALGWSASFLRLVVTIGGALIVHRNSTAYAQ